MPIQFECSACSKILKVPDEHAGKSARCPSCQAVMQIPLESPSQSSPDHPNQFRSQFGLTSSETPSQANPFAGAVGSTASSASSANPYSSPNLPKEEKAAIGGGSGQPTTVTFDEVFSYAWESWKANLGILVGATAAMWGVSIAVSIVTEIFNAVMAAADPDLLLLAALISGVIQNCVNVFMAIGMVQITLDLLRTGRADFGTLFSGGGRLLPVLGAGIIAGIAMVIGFLLLIVPGIFLALMFWGYYYQIIDRKSKAMESFSDAYQYCNINKGTTFVLWLASMGIAIIGVLALCIGLLFAAPLIAMMSTVAYLKMSGQLPGSYQENLFQR